MPLNGLDAVLLAVDDLSAGRDFCGTFGLSQRESGGTSADFVTLDQGEVLIRRVDDPGLPAPVCSGSNIREVVWGATDSADLDEIAGELAKDRAVTRDADGVVHSHDDDGYGIAIRLTRRIGPPPSHNRANVFGAPPTRPVNARIDFAEAVRPASLAHVVLFTPDVPRASRFYIERLGFRISDTFAGGRGAFLRAPGSSQHHTLFLIRAEGLGLHHVAFHVRDFTDIMNGGLSMLKAGFEPKFGPGRHVIGSNYFWYFNSPFGGAMELTADVDVVDDNWLPKEWEYRPDVTAAWSMTVNTPSGR